jgi:hypothetical protein
MISGRDTVKTKDSPVNPVLRIPFLDRLKSKGNSLTLFCLPEPATGFIDPAPRGEEYFPNMKTP